MIGPSTEFDILRSEVHVVQDMLRANTAKDEEIARLRAALDVTTAEGERLRGLLGEALNYDDMLREYTGNDYEKEECLFCGLELVVTHDTGWPVYTYPHKPDCWIVRARVALAALGAADTPNAPTST